MVTDGAALIIRALIIGDHSHTSIASLGVLFLFLENLDRVEGIEWDTSKTETIYKLRTVNSFLQS